MSTGFIAGGTIAGVIVAFLSFNDTIPGVLTQWQFRRVAVSQAGTLDGQIHDIAVDDLGLNVDSAADHAAEVKERADEILELNKSDLPHYAIVPAGTRLKLPDDTNAVVQQQKSLGDVAKDLLGKAGEASRLLDLNDKTISLPNRLPDGTALKVPQRNWPAIAIFSMLSILLLFIGVRNVRKPVAAAKNTGG